MTTDPQTAAVPPHVYRVSEIRDAVVRRTHGYFASLPDAFAYCETEERKKPLVDSVRFELFATPGGKQWLIHKFYGPKDGMPETSDFVISQHEVIGSAMPAAPVAAPPAGQADEPVRCPLCADAPELTTPAEAREHFTTAHPEWPLVGPGPWPMLGMPPTGRAAYLLAVDAIERMRGYPRLVLPEEIVEELRRLAAETPGPETQGEAHPAEHTWAAELQDPLTEEWVPGTRYVVRDRAVNHLAHARSIGPAWKDGTPTERRLVRATTTYAVEAEAEHTPDTVPAVDVQLGTDGCTCIPFIRQDGTPRYCGPTDTVDMISGWERGTDCLHHAPAVVAEPGKENGHG